MTGIFLDVPITDEDLKQAAEDALALYPTKRRPMSGAKLISYVMKYGDGQYIRVDEIPKGMTRERFEGLINRVAIWARWPFRRDQLQDPDLARLHSHVELKVCDFCCEETGLKRRNFAFAEIVRIPLETVPLTQRCFCAYRAVRKSA